ncbi:acyltransferase family protein [Corallincola spongiicola]|uniref:acyltransferase family protein n=1 Tax=Corallincola spongiicola TaxID=2520508 RepID=UPI0013EED061|nr:acyltransferase [Corallincola spongiicola]
METWESIKINKDNQVFLNRLRGMSILRVVLSHLGLSWLYTPYSQVISVFLPILFFVSGAISIYIYSRSRNTYVYFFHRLTSQLLPVYIIVLLSFLFIYILSGGLSFDIGSIARWLQLIPKSSDMPFPLGQVWFIHTLILISLFSTVIFYISKCYVKILPLTVVITFIFSYVQLFYPLGDLFSIYGHNIYKPIVHSSFFFFGAFWVLNPKAKIFNYSGLISILFLCLALFSFWSLDLEFKMTKHVYFPDGYYVSFSFFAVFIVLAMKGVITKVFDRVNFIDRFVLFFSKHAYSIFISHSLFIFLFEKYILIDDSWPKLIEIVIKILMVILASCIVAPTVSKSTDFFVKRTRLILKV